MAFDVFSIRDVLVGFGPIVCDSSTQSAIRNFRSLSSSKDVPFRDLELYRIGRYDTYTGVIDSFSVPELIIRGSDILCEDGVDNAACKS